MTKSLKNIALGTLVSLAAVAYGNTTWYFNSSLGIDTTSQANGNMVLTNANCMSYWTNALGQAGTGLPTAEDDLVFDGDKGRIRIANSSFDSFGGHSLQVGTDSVGETLVYDGGHITATGYPLKLGYTFLFLNSKASRDIDLPIEILAEDPSKPTVVAVGNINYVGWTYAFKGAISGSANAQLRFGQWPNAIGSTKPTCASNSTFRVDDITQYAGTLAVSSAYENDGGNFGSRLRLYGGTQQSAAKIRIERGGSLSLKEFGDTVTVKELSLAAGSRLWFNQASQTLDGKLWCVRATDALTVDGPVEIYSMPIIRGIEHFRIPILAGPATSTFTTNDFYITYTAEKYNLDLHLEVGTDEVTGDRTLYVVSHGFVYQVSNYSGEGGRAGGDGSPSSITNDAAWWGGLAPHPTNSLAHYRTARGLCTLYAPNERYEFPCWTFRLQNGELCLQTRTFEVPEFFCDGGTIGIGMLSNGPDIRLVAPHIHFTHGRVMVRAWRADTLILDGELDGPGDILFTSWSSTSSPKSNYGLTGLNTNYTGSITVSQGEYRDEYISFGNKHPTLYVNDGRNLGGAKAEFDPRALTLTHMAKLLVTNTVGVTLADGLNRGVYLHEKGRFDVRETNGVLDVQWPLLLSGKMWKEGLGTLVLGKGMKHEADDGGELTDVPRAGSNLFEIVAGTVKIANADALAGVETTIDAGATLQLAIDPANADLTEYGIRNTTVDAPFALAASFGGKLPLTLDNAGTEIPAGCRVMTNALVTVKSTSAEAVGAMLSAVKPWRTWGFKSEIVPRVNGDTDTTTLLLVSRSCGTALYLR